MLLSDDHKLLFAVNQGSNSIAVFNVDSQTGALAPVAGSPFSSFGTAPIGLGYSNGTLVVANHGISAPFAPASIPALPVSATIRRIPLLTDSSDVITNDPASYVLPR